MSTYLLVHGAWHEGRCWERVAPLLEAAGHQVLAPSLTGYGDKAHLLGPEVGLDTHVADVVALIEQEDLTGVVLVGHSYAGLVVSSVANAVPGRIAHLVYLDAMVPEDPAVQAIPRTHIHNTVKPQGIVRRRVQAVQPNGSSSQVWELPTGHDCMITMPVELSELLLKLGP